VRADILRQRWRAFSACVNIVEQPGAQHVASAAGIIFLFDPFNSPEFRRAIRETKDPQLEKPVVDQQDIILAEMRARIQMIRNLRFRRDHQYTRCICRRQKRRVASIAEWNSPSRAIAGWETRQKAVEENSNAVRQLVHRLCPAVVANAEALSTNVMFFAASAFATLR